MKIMLLLALALPMTAAAKSNRICYSAQTVKNVPCRDLAKKNFDRKNLESADWAGNDLSHSSFVGANLRHATLFETTLTRANFKNADMYGAALYGATFYHTNLDGADLSGADFNAADLRYAIITDRTRLNGSSYSLKTTKLPLAWGEFANTEANRRGMLPIREK